MRDFTFKIKRIDNILSRLWVEATVVTPDPDLTPCIKVLEIPPEELNAITSLTSVEDQRAAYRKYILKYNHVFQHFWESQSVAKNLVIPEEMLTDVTQEVDYPEVTEEEANSVLAVGENILEETEESVV